MMSNSTEVSGHVSLSNVEGQEHYGNLLNEKPPNQFEQLQFYYWDSLLPWVKQSVSPLDSLSWLISLTESFTTDSGVYFPLAWAHSAKPVRN